MQKGKEPFTFRPSRTQYIVKEKLPPSSQEGAEGKKKKRTPITSRGYSLSNYQTRAYTPEGTNPPAAQGGPMET